MHPDLERTLFIEHLTKLRQENERLSMTPGRDERQVVQLNARIERLETEKAVLRARLTACSMPAKPTSDPAKTGLGDLTHEQVVELHRRQMDGVAITTAAGVALCSLSRWRKANGYVLTWVPRAQLGD